MGNNDNIDEAMNLKSLVSIISPCYNGAKYLRGFLDSVIAQTYRPIELIFVDDGSTDNTKEIFESYRETFEKTKIYPIYIYQENAGQASAINQGLCIYKGEYLMWSDSDDILLPQNIEIKVDYLEKHPEKGFVLCQGVSVKSGDLNTGMKILKRQADEPLDNMELFEDLILERNVVYVPATIMVRRQAVIKAIPSLRIYESRQGQNWQLMLPLAYCCEYGLIRKPLFKYVIHEDSHSHSERTYNEQILRSEEFEKLIITTIKNIPGISDLDRWTKLVKTRYARRKCYLSCIEKKYEEARKYQMVLKQIDKVKLTDRYFICLTTHIITCKLSKIKHGLLKR
jgi:glycosyltransferase involved in cell wall biosynthesis